MNVVKNIVLIFLGIFSCIFAESEPSLYIFPRGTERTGPISDRNLSNCFEYFYENEKIGREEYYHDSGKIKKQTLYKKGKKDGNELLWFPDGQLEMSTPFNDGLIDGIWREWGRTGFLEGSSTFIKGTGKRTKHYQNGNIKLSEEYKNNHLDGFSRYYYENGQLATVAKYQVGIQIDMAFSFGQDGTLESFGTLGKHGEINGYLVMNKDHKYPIIEWFDNGVSIWSSTSGTPAPKSMIGKEQDPKKVYDSITIPPEYLQKD